MRVNPAEDILNKDSYVLAIGMVTLDILKASRRGWTAYLNKYGRWFTNPDLQ